MTASRFLKATRQPATKGKLGKADATTATISPIGTDGFSNFVGHDALAIDEHAV